MVIFSDWFSGSQEDENRNKHYTLLKQVHDQIITFDKNTLMKIPKNRKPVPFLKLWVTSVSAWFFLVKLAGGNFSLIDAGMLATTLLPVVLDSEYLTNNYFFRFQQHMNRDIENKEE